MLSLTSISASWDRDRRIYAHLAKRMHATTVTVYMAAGIWTGVASDTGSQANRLDHSATAHRQNCDISERSVGRVIHVVCCHSGQDSDAEDSSRLPLKWHDPRAHPARTTRATLRPSTARQRGYWGGGDRGSGCGGVRGGREGGRGGPGGQWGGEGGARGSVGGRGGGPGGRGGGRGAAVGAKPFRLRLMGTYAI